MSKESGSYSWWGYWNDKKDLDYYTNLVDKAVAGFERTDSNSERISSVNKMSLNITACYSEIAREKKN